MLRLFAFSLTTAGTLGLTFRLFSLGLGRSWLGNAFSLWLLLRLFNRLRSLRGLPFLLAAVCRLLLPSRSRLSNRLRRLRGLPLLLAPIHRPLLLNRSGLSYRLRRLRGLLLLLTAIFRSLLLLNRS